MIFQLFFILYIIPTKKNKYIYLNKLCCLKKEYINLNLIYLCELNY